MESRAHYLPNLVCERLEAPVVDKLLHFEDYNQYYLAQNEEIENSRLGLEGYSWLDRQDQSELHK